MKSTNNFFLLLLSFLFFINAEAQSNDAISYSLKKGQVFDIILLTTKEGIDDLRKYYFDTALPVAIKAGYTPLKGFGIKEKPLQGNYHPGVMVFGAWPSISVREKFLEDIEKEVPDFHDMRKSIWSTFDLTYWEMQEDVAFEVDRSRFNVVTALWGKEGRSIESYKKAWLKESAKRGATALLQLTDGTSPFGYTYDPDFLVLTTWENRGAYDAFMEKAGNMDRSSLKLIQELTF